MSSSSESIPKLNLTASNACSSFKPIAIATCEGLGSDEEQADPVENAN